MSETPGPATAAMRLRPAARRHGEAERSTPATGAYADGHRELVERLDVVLGLHTPLEIVPDICRECFTLHPCRTWLAATGETDTPTPPEGNDT